MMKLILIIFAALAVANGCKIAFRLDDIQDFYASSQQRVIIDKFITKGYPLSIGIIANYFGTDATLVNYIKNVVGASDNEIEVCSHGCDHEDFSTFTMEEQTTLLEESADKIAAILPGAPRVKTFIAPYNAINTDTLLALKTAGYTHVSSSNSIDPGPFANTKPIYHYPAGASTTNWQVTTTPVPASTTLAEIQNQLNLYGFAVVMMHPQCYLADPSWLDELDYLLDKVADFGCDIRLFNQMQDSTTQAPTTAPTSNPTTAPTSAPTTAPTSAPTTAPTSNPTSAPTSNPTTAPTSNPTSAPTSNPTTAPTTAPTSVPTSNPTSAPTSNPTSAPTSNPTSVPTPNPTAAVTATTSHHVVNPTDPATPDPTGAAASGLQSQYWWVLLVAALTLMLIQ